MCGNGVCECGIRQITLVTWQLYDGLWQCLCVVPRPFIPAECTRTGIYSFRIKMQKMKTWNVNDLLSRGVQPYRLPVWIDDTFAQCYRCRSLHRLRDLIGFFLKKTKWSNMCHQAAALWSGKEQCTWWLHQHYCAIITYSPSWNGTIGIVHENWNVELDNSIIWKMDWRPKWISV